MHPFLRSPKQVLMVGLLWSPLCFWVVILHKYLVDTEWTASVVLVLPPMALKLVPCLSIWYICKATRLERRNPLKPVVTHLTAMAVINGAWLLLILLYSNILDRVLKTGTWASLFQESLPLFLGVGVSLYFISALMYYLAQANEQIGVKEQEILKQRIFTGEAELKALKSTIHPHFLFNGLNMIGPLIRQAPERAQTFVAQLSDFLLYSLRYGKKHQVTVQDELDHITNYLAVEKERLGDRLTVDLTVDREVLDRSLLPLTLLPLVENAVKHGIQQCLEGGTLSIAIGRAGHDLQVTIKNPYETPAHRARGEGLGLETVRKRIRVYYGPEAVLTVKKDNTVFQVTLRIPAREEKKE
jgi:sensor histidine kinase YesM